MYCPLRTSKEGSIDPPGVTVIAIIPFLMISKGQELGRTQSPPPLPLGQNWLNV